MRRINYKSDIPPLLLSLKVDENQITVPDCDFIVRFYIEGYEGRHYDCSHIGGAWSNCEPSEDGTKLVCYINNQRLGIGELCAEFHYISPDRRYSDGSQKSVVIIGSTELGVELVEDNGDAVTEAAIDVTLPFIYRTAYEIARDHGYTGTAEDFYGALASVVGISEAEKKRVTAEITRNANEQERIENEENRLNAESERVNAEAQRVRNEAIRGDAEGDRVEQEEDRKAKFQEITGFIATVRANEGNRESNERERQTNEDTRITEEAKRVEAEKKRVAEFEQQKLDLAGKIDRSGDEMGGDLIFTDNTGVSFSTSDGGAHTMFNDTDDVAKFTADNGDTFEFKQNETPNKNSSAVVVSENLYNALDMTLDSMGSALDGDAAYRAEAGDKIFNPDTGKIQRYNSTIGGFEDLCDPIKGKLYANKMTGYIYRWNTKAKKMVFVGGVKAYTKDEADRRFAKLDDATQRVKVKELEANNFVSANSMWIGDEGLLLNGDGNGHLTVEQDEVITNVTLNEKLATKADDVAYGVEWSNGQHTGEMQETTIKDATKNTTVATLFLAQSFNALESEVEKKADKTELDTKVDKSDIVQSTGTSTTAVMSQKSVSDAIAVEETRAKEAEENLVGKVTDLDEKTSVVESIINDVVTKGKVGKNLINLSALEAGRCVGRTGEIDTSFTSYSHTPHIDVSAYDSIVISCQIKITAGFDYALFDSSKAFVRGGAYDIILKDDALDRYYYVINTADVDYIIISNITSIFNAREWQAENGTNPTSYEVYRLIPSTIKESVLDASNTIKIIKYSISGNAKKATATRLNSNESLTIGGNSVRKNKILNFYAKISNFGALYIGRDDSNYGYILKIDSQNISFGRTLESSFSSTLAHGLTISNYIAVDIVVTTGTGSNNSGERAVIKISTLGGMYEREIYSWDGVKGAIIAKLGTDTSLYYVNMTWTSWDYQCPIWMFGDSYFSHYATERWTYHLLSKFGFDNVLMNAYPGEEAEGAYNDWKDALSLGGTPKIAIWCLGMNNADIDANTINASWRTYTEKFIADCEELGVTPILQTIPNVPTRTHVAKNAWIKASGFRYMDFAEAVGAEEAGSTWITGCLENATARVHPTTNGARLLCCRALIDVPELCLNSKLQFGKLHNELKL